MPIYADSNSTQRARYLLLRTVACQGDGNEDGFPPANIEFDLERAYHKRPGIKSLYVDLFFDRQKTNGKHIRVNIAIQNKTIFVDGEEDGEPRIIPTNGAGSVCSVKNEGCKTGLIKIGQTSTGGYVFVQHLDLNVSLSLERTIDLSFGDEYAQELRHNVMGMIGNFDGDRGNDRFCPSPQQDPTEAQVYNSCWQVTPGGILSLDNEDSSMHKFFTCPEGLHVNESKNV